MRHIILLLMLTLFIMSSPSSGQADAAKLEVNPISIITAKDASISETLAAKEIRRYVYLRTGMLLTISTVLPDGTDAIVVARKDRQIINESTSEDDIKKAIGSLAAQNYILRTIKREKGSLLLIVGGDDTGALYGTYRFAELLGVRFYLHGDVIPDGKIHFALPELNETGKPLFAFRGIQPFHDFPEGPDWWNTDDYKAIIAQLPKMRMNFIGLHTYPERGPNAEPTVWIGLPADVADDGKVKFSYPSSYHNTIRGGWNWGYFAKKTSDYTFGASQFFERDDYGADVMIGMCPEPKTPEDSNELFNRTGTMLRDAFSFARSIGVKTCVGTEIPLTIPRDVREHLKSLGKNPDDIAVVQELYEGIFTRIAKAYPIDYYWFWTPEWWLGNVKEDHVKRTIADMQAAVEAAKKVNAPFTLATCGWVLGPQSDRTLFDKSLPKEMPLSCISKAVGFAPVEQGFARLSGRSKWAIPWLEDDPAMTTPQLWVGRMRRDALDAFSFGCDGLMGIHWRTRILSPNVSALAQAAWDQSKWNIAPKGSGPADGSVAHSNNPIDKTEDDPIYQNIRWGLTGYRLTIPKGIYKVTLRFCESHFANKGQRVFDVILQGNRVLENFDIIAEAGVNTAYDRIFENIEILSGYLDVEFSVKSDNPTIAAIEVTGNNFTKKINCGGEAYKDYEADPEPGPVPAYAPVEDFYKDWAFYEFGAAVADETAAIFSKIDGKLPRPAGWIGGPGGIAGDSRTWEEASKEYAFVDELAALRPKVKGEGNLSRFDYWLNTFQYLKAAQRLRCKWGEYDKAMVKVNEEKDPAVKAKLAKETAVPLRRQMIPLAADVHNFLYDTTTTNGEMGTIENWQQHIYPFDEHGKHLTQALGEPIPPDAMPPKEYTGKTRLVVPTVRTSIVAGEPLTLKAIIPAQKPPKEAALFWREMGSEKFLKIPLSHVARGVYKVVIASDAIKSDFEYYIEVKTAENSVLYFPATAPEMNQTIVVMPVK